MEDVALSRTFGEDAGRWFQEQLEANGVELPRRRGARAPSRATAGSGRWSTKSGLGDRVRRGRRRRRRAARRDAGRSGPGSRSTTADRLRLEAADLGRRASTPPATAAPTRASSTAAACGSSTGTWRCSRASTPPATCSATTRDYEVVPYFFSDLADWASLEYVGPAYEWDEEVWRGDRDERRVLGLVPEGRPRRRLPSASAAPKTWPRRGGCWPTASTSPAPRSHRR